MKICSYNPGFYHFGFSLKHFFHWQAWPHSDQEVPLDGKGHRSPATDEATADQRAQEEEIIVLSLVTLPGSRAASIHQPAVPCLMPGECLAWFERSDMSQE